MVQGKNHYTIQINPGLPTFPWLAQQAQGYDKYRIKKFVVTYVPKNATTSTQGTIYGAFDYDCDDSSPTDVKTIMTYQSAKSGCMYNKLAFPYSARCANEGMTWRRVRSGPTSHERFLYDPANFHLLIDVPVATPAAGQLIFSYTVEFSCPGLSVATTPKLPFTVATFVGVDSQSSANPQAARWQIAHAADFVELEEKINYNFKFLPGVYHIHASSCIQSDLTPLASGELTSAQAYYMTEEGEELAHSSYISIETEVQGAEPYQYRRSHHIDTYLVVNSADTIYQVVAATQTNLTITPGTTFYAAGTTSYMQITLIS